MTEITWRKSSYSGQESACVEVAELPAAWRKSSYSGQSDTSNCVEVAELVSAVGVRDSKDPGGGVLVLSHREFTGLAAGLRALS